MTQNQNPQTMVNQSPDGPKKNIPYPLTPEQEQEAILAAQALLSLTKTIHEASQGNEVSSPEFGQSVLQRGQLIEAIGRLPFSRFSDETQKTIIAALTECKALDPQVLGQLQTDRQKLSEQIGSLKSAKSVQNKYISPSAEESLVTRNQDA